MAISTTTAAVPDAVDALLKWKTTQSNSNNPQLLPQDDFIYLILTLKKIPQKGGINGARTNPNKIPLPHPLIPPNSLSEICLIIDDRPNSNLTSAIAKEKIKSDGISVSKVIKLSKLKTDYKPFESKRKLCDSYELFFADKRVIPLLPKLLGKQFFIKKKLPLGVDLSHKNWKEQIERGCCSGLLFFRTGTCCVIRVAKVSMERDEIVENVVAAVNGAVGFVPKKLGGVRSLHLKLTDSVVLPLYQSLPDVKLRIEGVKEKDMGVEGEDVMDIVEVGKKSKSKKARIHEVNHNEELDEGGEIENDVSISTELDAVEQSKKKKRKGGVAEVEKKKVSKKGKNNEVNDDEDENNDSGSVDLKSKKKKVSKKGKNNEVNDDEDENNDSGSVDLKSKRKKVSKKVKIVEVNHDADEETKKIDDFEVVSVGVKEKKRKGNVVSENDVKLKSSDKKAKKKQNGGDSGKKEKKKGRSVSRV